MKNGNIINDNNQNLMQCDDKDLIQCDCGWYGTYSELKTVMDTNPNNLSDKTLYENKVCPDCKDIFVQVKKK